MATVSKQVLYPGNTLGIIGSGYLGAKLAIAAKSAGFKVGMYDANQVDTAIKQADFTVIGGFNDRDKLKEFAQSCDAIVYVNALVDSAMIEFLSRFAYVPQGKEALEIIQDRLLERAFFDQINVNIAPYVTVVGLDDIYQSIDSIGYPAMLKPIQRGIGERSMKIDRQVDIAKAADFIDAGTYVLESYISHQREFSLTIGKGKQGMKLFPITEVQFEGDQIKEVQSPAQVPTDVKAEIERIGNAVASTLPYVGVFEIGFYLTETGSLYVKGITLGLTRQAAVFDASLNVDQYLEHIRAIAGIELHEVGQIQPVLLMNIDETQLDDLKRQWVLKNNWQFVYYPRTDENKSPIYGHVLVTGDSLEKMQLQVDNTEVWSTATDSENA